MPFVYLRTIHFQDTDAAGVVYFANVLAICHEAYEASLAATGINLKVFFGGGNGGNGTTRTSMVRSAIAIPIVHASVDFFHPMFCGEQYVIQMKPSLLTDSKFAISYGIFSPESIDKRIGQATTIHVCIDAVKRNRVNLPAEVMQWLHRWQAETETPL